MTKHVNQTTNKIVEVGTFEELKNIDTDDGAVATDCSNPDEQISVFIEDKRPRLRVLLVGGTQHHDSNTAPRSAAAPIFFDRFQPT